ncbi:solute carrier family 22 member 4-like [Cynoglossus semilaevis]|uniref:solute carrier family 22 member 4-like n=1 Tax=Cynoglossus semilaevis TaxID=244447 RepID=UPI000D62F411|nr:solute carrier family 22 member 4-like [Cynoglossus semilaevis]
MSGRTRDYDEVTSFLGSFGHFQVVVIVLLSLSTVPCGYFGVMVVFVSDTPAHHCRIPLNSTATSTSEELHFEERSRQVGPDSCSRYKVQGNRTERAELANDTEQCLDGWVYSTEFSSTTAVSEWDLVCDNAWKVPFSSSLFFFGVMIGSFVSGQLADRYVSLQITIRLTYILQLL